MKKGFKYLAAFVVLVLILSVAAGLLLMTMVNSDWVKTQISQYAKAATGRDLVIKGSLNASFWPQFGITVKDISLSNPSGFGGEPFLSAQKLIISAELMPLLHHQLSVNHASLSDAVINLQKNRQGQNNWSFNQSSGNTANQSALSNNPGSQTAANTPSENSAQQKTMQFDIAGLSLTHSTFNYSDAQANQHLTFKDVNITSSDLQADKPFPLSGAFTFINSEKKPTAIKLDTLVGYDSKTSILLLNNLNLHLKATDMDELKIKGKVTANLNTASIKISTLALEFGDMKINGDLTGNNLHDKPVLTGHINSNTFNLRKLLAVTNKPLSLKNKKALTQVQLTGDVLLSAQRISLKKLASTIDGHALSGELDYVLSPVPHLGFSLLSEELLVEDYLPSGDSTKSEDINKSTTSNSSGSLVVDGTVAVQRLSYGVYRLSGVKTNLRYVAKQLDLQNFSAGLFSGSSRGNISINFKGNAPSFAIDQSMSGIHVEEMLRTMIGSAKLSGVANLNINVKASGSASDIIKRNLSGAVSFNVSNGVIAGTDIDYKVDQAIAKYTQRSARLSDRGHTPFTHLTGTLSLGSGNATSRDLEFLTPSLRVQASGYHNFLNDSIDYKLTCRLLQVQEINANYLGVKINTDLSQYDIPAKVSCTLQNPCVNVDMLGLMKILATEGAKTAAKAVVQKQLLRHVDDNIGNVLGKILSH